MNLSVLDAHRTADGIAVTLISESGLHQLEGSVEQMSRLATVMRQVSVLAPLHDGEQVWLEDITVGDADVTLGLSTEGRTRVLIRRT
jgi:hypothetical protein